jgi:hypothetical protein
MTTSISSPMKDDLPLRRVRIGMPFNLRVDDCVSLARSH